MTGLEHRFTAMGGPCRLRLHGDDLSEAAAAAEGEVRRLEARYSRYDPNSLASAINRAAGSGESVAIDAETAGLLRYADTVWRESGGLFDLTAGVLRHAWDFKSGKPPSQDALDAVLPLIGWDRVQWNDNGVSLPEAGMELDFGGVVKEYACDCVARVLADRGIGSALIDLAGDMVALGAPPDETAWQVGIRHPRGEGAMAWVPLANLALASSGDYERCIVIDDRRLGHILHPRTGWPVEGLLAVSVLAPQCLVAGSTATIAMLKPADQALSWLANLGLPWFAVDADLACHGSIAPAH